MSRDGSSPPLLRLELPGAVVGLEWGNGDFGWTFFIFSFCFHLPLLGSASHRSHEVVLRFCNQLLVDLKAMNPHYRSASEGAKKSASRLPFEIVGGHVKHKRFAYVY